MNKKKRKDLSDLKRPPKWNCPQHLHTHNVPIDDMENTNGTYLEKRFTIR